MYKLTWKWLFIGALVLGSTILGVQGPQTVSITQVITFGVKMDNQKSSRFQHKICQIIKTD